MIATKLLAASFSLLFVGPVAYMAFDRDPPLNIISESIVTETVEQGGQLLISYRLDRKRVCQTTLEHFVFDADGVITQYEPITSQAFGPVGDETKIRGIALRPTSAPGPAKYRLVLTYRCNPVHHWFPIKDIRADLRFIITEKPNADQRSQ